MLGQPASSQTVCRPSRRTSDFSSVYSGPVFSRVLIHSGLRSIGTWLLRTSRRSSLRPEGARGVSVEGVGATVSLMIDHGTPGDGNARLDGGGRCCSGAGRGQVAGLRGSSESEPIPPEAVCGWSFGEAVAVSSAGSSGLVVAVPGVAEPGVSVGLDCCAHEPASVSGGVASPAVVWAVETVLPELLGELGTGSSR